MDEKTIAVLSRLDDASPLPVGLVGAVEREDCAGLLESMQKDGLVDQLGGSWFLTSAGEAVLQEWQVD